MSWAFVRNFGSRGFKDLAMVGGGRGKLSQINVLWICWMILRSARLRLFFTGTSILVVFLTCFIRGWIFTLSQQPAMAADGTANETFIWNSTLYNFASVDAYSERVENFIVRRILESGVVPGRQGHQSDNSKQYVLDKHNRLRLKKPDRWEIELNRLKYRRYWPRFMELLRAWSANRYFEPQVMKLLIKMVKEPLGEPSTLDPVSGENQTYKTCAVVGNSGILLRKHYGKLIDFHEMVIRINGAKTRSFEPYVGSKTTLAFINSNVLRSYFPMVGQCRYPYEGKVPLLVYMCQAVHLMDVACCRDLQPNTPLLVTDARFDNLCARIAKWYSVKKFLSNGGDITQWEAKHGGTLFHYSSGLQAIVLALGICERVSIFGFGKGSGVKHHYHTNQRSELPIHDYAAEYDFYQDLENNKSSTIAFLNEARGFVVPPVRMYH